MTFKIQRKLERGELVEVAIHADFEKAEEVVRAFKENWPGVYLITEIGAETGANVSEIVFKRRIAG